MLTALVIVNLLLLVAIAVLLLTRSGAGKGDAARMAVLQEKAESLGVEVQDLKAGIEALRLAESNARAELARKDEAAKGLLSEVQRLKDALRSGEDAASLANASLREAESARVALDEALKAARASLEELRGDNAKLKAEISSANEALLASSREGSRLKAELDAAGSRLEKQESEMKRLQEEASAKFELIANKLLEEKGDKFSKLHAERLAEVLAPFRENLGEFRKRVEEVHSSDVKDRSALQEQIKLISETNKRLGEDARNLAEALKGDSKLVGDWGETLLHGILEGSGLQEGVEYFKQESVRDADGNLLRPDVVLKLPQGRAIVIDSKVSIAAYVDCCNAKDDASRQAAAQRHLRSVKEHLDELDFKAYQAHVEGTLDFVIMFVPNEPAYNLAIHEEPALWQAAFSKKIVLASPTNLFAILRIVSELWRKERETVNFVEIVEKCSALYDKFATFLSFMDDLGKGLDNARNSYDKAVKNLKDGHGNLVDRVESIRELGLKTKKRLPDAWLAAASRERELPSAGPSQADSASD